MYSDWPHEIEQFVSSEISSGHFADRDEVILHLLRLFQRDREETIAGIKAGLADVAHGRVEILAEAFHDIRRSATSSE